MRVVLEVLRWLTGVWLLWQVPGPRARAGLELPSTDSRPSTHPRPAPARARPRVSVVIPARNEEANLPPLLASLVGQTSRPDEVLVVDDHSEDATSTVARDGGATCIPAPDLPSGWTGKCWACWTGAQAASGDVLVFLDADVTLAPDALGRLLDEHGRRGGLVSVQPLHVMRRAYERLSAFFNLIALMGLDAFSPLRGRVAPTGACGPCLLVGSHDYFAVGGHEAVRAEVLDDVALGRRFVEVGVPVSVFGGRDVLRYRMYPHGLRQLLEGWSKNIAGGARTTRLPTLVLVAVWLSGCTSAVLGLFGVGGLSLPAAAVLYLAYAAQLQWMLRRVGRFGSVTALLFPVPLVFFIGLFVVSIVLSLGVRQVRWKGREIAT